MCGEAIWPLVAVVDLLHVSRRPLGFHCISTITGPIFLLELRESKWTVYHVDRIIGRGRPRAVATKCRRRILMEDLETSLELCYRVV